VQAHRGSPYPEQTTKSNVGERCPPSGTAIFARLSHGWYHSPICRNRKAIATAAIVIAALATLASSQGASAAASKAAYEGAGTWIDIYDGQVLADPLGTVEVLSLNGVRTIYVETANFSNPPSPALSIRYPVSIAALIDAAHANGIRVVAWYLPGFKNYQRDLRRSLDAIRFTTLNGGRFDSFALDIESNAVRKVALRNKRALRLSKRIRAAVGSRYPLGAIVPDSRSTSVSLPSLWPRFPYRRLRKIYDVFLPMSYSTFRGKGSGFVYTYTRANVEYVRAATGDSALPVHAIGGIADRLGTSEDAAVVDAAVDEGAIGASFYKLRLSGTGEWQALTGLTLTP
jgi:hypothetical protein